MVHSLAIKIKLEKNSLSCDAERSVTNFDLFPNTRVFHQISLLISWGSNRMVSSCPPANDEFVGGAHVGNLKLSSMLKSYHLLLLFGLWKIIQLFLGKDKFCYNTRSENQLDWPWKEKQLTFLYSSCFPFPASLKNSTDLFLETISLWRFHSSDQAKRSIGLVARTAAWRPGVQSQCSPQVLGVKEPGVSTHR